MGKHEYGAGQAVYGKGGEEYEYVLFVPGTNGRPDKHLIRYEVPADYHEDAGVEVEETRLIVFSECPEPTRSRQHVAFEASLRAERDELLKEVSGLRTDKEAMRKERKTLTAQLERLRQLAPAMRRVEDFLDDKITHLVIADKYGGLKIEALADALVSGKDTRLISLFGRTNGDLVWQVNDHYDYSGSWTEITPCTSMEHALEVAGAIIAELVAGGEKPKIRAAMKWADANGRPFPAEVRAKVIAQQRVALLNNERTAAEKHAKTQQALDDFDASTVGGAQ